MNTLTRSQQAELAKEIAAAQPIPEWSDNNVLNEWHEPVAMPDGTKVKMGFDELVIEYKKLDAKINQIEAKKKALRESAQAAFLLSGAEAVKCEGYRVAMVHRDGSKKISREKLLEKGVPVTTIIACTEVGKPSDYLDIREVKGK